MHSIQGLDDVICFLVSYYRMIGKQIMEVRVGGCSAAIYHLLQKIVLIPNAWMGRMPYSISR